MPGTEVTYNGTDLSTLGFRFRGRVLPALAPESTVKFLPDYDDGLYMGEVPAEPTLDVTGYWKRADHAAARAALDSFTALRAKPDVIRFSDWTDREYVGYMVAPSRADIPNPQWIADGGNVTLRWRLAFAGARAQALTTITGSNPTLVLGAMPSPLRVTVVNGATAPITSITVAIRAGSTVLRQMVWVGSLAVAQTFDVDTEARVLTAAAANAWNGLQPGYSLLYAPLSATNVLVTIVGGPAASITTRYYKRWRS